MVTLAFDTPILLITFNRLDTTKRVFEKIKQQKPRKLYLASDGARKDKIGEDIKVKEVRTFLSENIDWKCEVKTLFQEKNLGCNHGPHNAITWFFENEKEGIILEDDCLPSESFFSFCESLLKYYRNDLRIFTISGFNIHGNFNNCEHSYFFNKFPITWGWATWRDRWELNLKTIKTYNKDSFIIANLTNDEVVNKIIENNAEQAIKNEVDAWDFIWIYTNYLNSANSVVPCKNLIENIGYNLDATHTKPSPYDIKHPAEILENVILHPKFLLPNQKYDQYIYKDFFNWKNLSEKLINPYHIYKVVKSRLF